MPGAAICCVNDLNAEIPAWRTWLQARTLACLIWCLDLFGLAGGLTGLACKVPCSWIYGEGDWMDPAAGQKVCNDVASQRGKLSPTDLTVRASRCSWLQDGLQPLWVGL